MNTREGSQHPKFHIRARCGGVQKVQRKKAKGKRREQKEARGD